MASDERLWIPDDKEGYILGVVQADGSEEGKVVILDDKGKEREVDRSTTYPANPDNLDGVPDNTQLMHLHEPSLMHNLKFRYARDDIYTYTAYILIAVNPYQRLPIYGDDVIRQYQGKSMGVLPPHAYAVADRAYRSMKAARKSQSIIISGESGAGKTETAKIVMQYLAAVGSSTLASGENIMGVLEQRIIQCNPILEAFGNAKTLRNDNSSRFGKFTKILFDRNALVSGASIVTYLLEKSRLVHQAENERNYHIFYQLCAGASPEERDVLDIHEPQMYDYLNQSGCYTLDHADDGEDYATMRESMGLLGFSDEDQAYILETVAGILHMGNIKFKGLRSGGLMIENEEEVATAARLLHLNERDFRSKLCNKTITTRGESYTSPLTEQQAVYSRDALAKMIYSRLFDWIVAKINQALVGEEDVSFIGVLDIYGFEWFETNSFEQFCINLANEKLQQHFNHQVLRQEQEIYAREGITVNKIEFVDNQDCIDLIEAKGSGILSILDEECRMPKPSSEKFCDNIHATHGKHARLARPKNKKGARIRLNASEGFAIRHFAGEVTYTAELFIDKNNDSLNPDLASLVKSSESPFVQELFANDAAATESSSRRKKSFQSIGAKFSKQLGHLMENLMETVSHFIRCVKPNPDKVPGRFDALDSLNQLRCSGMLEALLLMHEGFPTRCPYEDLYDRYRDVVPPILSAMDSASFCEALFMALEVDKSEFQLGITKVFFRAGRLAFLDELRGSEYKELAKDIAEKVRKWLAKKRLRRAIMLTRSLYYLQRRVEQRRAAAKLADASLTVFLLSATWMKKAKRLKRNRSARLIQALVRGMIVRKRLHGQRKAATQIQRLVRGHLARVKYGPVLEELRVERERKRAEEEEALKAMKEEERALRLEAERKRMELERQRIETREKERADRARRRAEQEEAELAEKAALAKLQAEASVAATAEAREETQRKIEEAIAEGLNREKTAMLEELRAEAAALEASQKLMLDFEEQFSTLAGEVERIREHIGDDATARNNEKELRIEVRLRELERQVREANTAAAEERAARTELEKTVRQLQTSLRTQVAEANKRLDEEYAARLELEKTVYALQLALNTGAGLQRRTPVRARRDSVVAAAAAARRRSVIASPDASPLIRTASKGKGGADSDSEDDNAPANAMAALASLQKAGEALTPTTPTPDPSAGPKAVSAPEPIVRLRKAVAEIEKHFSSQTTSTTNRAALGDDCKNNDIGRLVRGQLCSALVRIFWHGFKSFKLIGRYHLWDFFTKLHKELDEVDKNSQLSLSRAIEIVNNSHELVKNNDVRFRSLVCYGLNYKILHVWISLLTEDEPVVVKWFESWSFIRSPTIRQQIVTTLAPLTEFPFCMSLDYEIASWDL